MAPPNGAPQQVDPVQANLAARQLILSRAQPMRQILASQTLTAAQILAGQNVMNFTPRNVGLLKGFIVEVTGSLTNDAAATAAATRTGRGVYNAVTNFIYTDLQTNQRINTSGWHIGLLNTAKLGYGYGGAYAPNLPASFGNNWNVNTLAASIADGGTEAYRVCYYLPLAYSSDDLTGAIYTGVTGATQNLQITLNPSPGFTTGDSLLKMAGGANTVVSYTPASNVTVTVYQEWWDQLPATPQGVILPLLDIGTSYMINTTNVSGIVANQDFPVQYANFRKFLSTFALFNNFNGSNGEAAFGVGADVNQWKISTANYTNLEQQAPEINALDQRRYIMSDFPPGSYYWDHRRKPIDTVQYGNMQLLLNAITVNANAYLALGYEAFADTNIVTQAGSLPGG